MVGFLTLWGVDVQSSVAFDVSQPHGVHDEIDCRKRCTVRLKRDTMRLREFCGSQSCSVVLLHALGSIGLVNMLLITFL
jgi:hypothetical protein